MDKKDVICWWSGGITSAVACKVAIDLFGIDRCRVVMIDTFNEHPDTYRFKEDCSKWYGKQIEVITDIGKQYENIQDVWRKHKSLNVATGAICSTQLKRRVREKWQETIDYDYQVFGFEFDKKEFNRAKSLEMNHPKAKSIYPLLMFGYDKDKCIEIVQEAGIEIPIMYKMGFRNNNCFGTGCVQGGIGYWQKMKRDFPDKFNEMADMEHELTALKGSPVTMLKDQSKSAKETGNILVFLRKHPDYPNLKSIDDMPECEVKPLFECNGFCGTNDLIPRSDSENQINFQFE
jgi:3'-phosphoadenosine 5'-phosphosulfate sulfotransferase (PAPS reductase)/FAD synthetase